MQTRRFLKNSLPISRAKFQQIVYSVLDQGFSVGGMFLVNVALARTQSKEEYGMFALCYSIFTFLAGLHNSVILEPYTVYGSGRYAISFNEYYGLMFRSNAALSAALSALLLTSCLVLGWLAPQYFSGALLGLSLGIGFLLTGLFLRRVFYIQRRPELAARVSLIFFIALGTGLLLVLRLHELNSLAAFLISGAAWLIAGVSVVRLLPRLRNMQRFTDLVPEYWAEHWKYSRWVFTTAFVFQLTSQGYYWLIAGFLSVKEVADLKAMLIVLAPVDQIYIAFGYLILPALAARYAAMNIRGLVSVWKWCLLANTGLMGGFALCVFFLGRPVAHLLYAGKFDPVLGLLPLLALFPVLMGIGNTMNAALKATENPKFVFQAYAGSGSVTLLLGAPLVRAYGLRGAVYGMLLSATAYSAVLGWRFFQNVYRKQEPAVAAAY